MENEAAPALPLRFGGDPVWLLEDRLGRQFEVRVEPATAELYDVGDALEVDGESYRLVSVRGTWVQAIRL